MGIKEVEIQTNGQNFKTLYRIEGITDQEARKLALELFTDPVNQRFSIDANKQTKGVEIGYKPGVTDPTEASIIKTSKNLGINVAAVSTSRIYRPKDAPVLSQVQMYIDNAPQTLILDHTARETEQIFIRDLEDEMLLQLSKKRSLFLDLTEMRAIQDYAKACGRELTDIEIETIASTWSEHCGHKTFKARLIGENGEEIEPLMTRLKETSRKYFDRVGVVSAFSDNAGALAFEENQVIAIKGETHNSPVAIEPFGGAATKNGGVYRDIAGFGKGARTLASVVVNCFMPHQSRDIPRGVLPPKTLINGNSRGERSYGNPMGIPTYGINIHFDKSFKKPTSMGIVIGITHEKFVFKDEPQIGDLIVTVGGKTGRDGVHGATFSSGAMAHDTDTVHSTAVQIGNPIEEKRMFDALIACRDNNLIRSITDCGAGGYCSAVGEMAQKIGAVVDLDKVSLKYKGLSPWEIFVSESQERMVIAVSPENWDQFREICDLYNTPAVVIGEFTGDKNLKLKYDGELIGNLSMDFLHDGIPNKKIEIKKKDRIDKFEVSSQPVSNSDWERAFERVITHNNVFSNEEMFRQYDQTVQGTSALAPFTGVNEDCPSDASVIAPIYGKPYGVVTSWATNPVLNRYDPYWGSVWSAAYAFSKFVSVGGDLSHAAINDNFVSPIPDANTVYDLSQSVDALCDMMDLVQVPCISGKDSLSSTYIYPDKTREDIPLLLNVSIFGKIANVEKTVSSDIKNPNGSILCVVGSQDFDALGGSVYYDGQNVENSKIPKINPTIFRKTLDEMQTAIGSGRVLSSKAIGEGGIAATLTQMCFGGDCGAIVDLNGQTQRSDHFVFNETPGVFLVELSSINDVEALFANVPHKILGITSYKKEIRATSGLEKLFTISLDNLKSKWKQPMEEILNDN